MQIIYPMGEGLLENPRIMVGRGCVGDCWNKVRTWRACCPLLLPAPLRTLGRRLAPPLPPRYALSHAHVSVGEWPEDTHPTGGAGCLLGASGAGFSK